MIKYYVQNGTVHVNKYAVKYSMVQTSGKMENDSKIVQYFSDKMELRGLTGELERKGIEF